VHVPQLCPDRSTAGPRGEAIKLPSSHAIRALNRGANLPAFYRPFTIVVVILRLASEWLAKWPS